MKNERTLTVSSQYYSPEGTFSFHDRMEKPLIRLNGFWLSEAGFNPRDRVKVMVADERLVIEKISERDAAAV